jgi:hypothetical protein
VEARPARRKPVSVTQTASTAKQALRGAVKKMSRLLETSVGKSETQGLRTLRKKKAARVAKSAVARTPKAAVRSAKKVVRRARKIPAAEGASLHPARAARKATKKKRP